MTTSRCCARRSSTSVARLVGDGDRSLMVDEFDGDEYELRGRGRRRPDPAVPHRAARGGRPRRRRGSAPTTWPRSSPTSAIRSPTHRSRARRRRRAARRRRSPTPSRRPAARIVDTGAAARAPGAQRVDRGAGRRRAGVRLDPPAKSAIADWLGEDVGRLAGHARHAGSATYGGAEAHGGRRRAVPRRGRRRAAVGPHRRHRPRRHGDGAGAAGRG